MVQSAHPKVFVVVPVFERLTHTLRCIDQLEMQTYPTIEIVVVDGGSNDGSVDALRTVQAITLIADIGEQWWTGATWFGIDYALQHGDEGDFVLLLNDDTLFESDFVERLVEESIAHCAAVGATIVDADDPTRILNAGITIDWPAYGFHLCTEPTEFNSCVDTLEGRGAIVPLGMVRQCGNVDKARLPHYIGDFEFFCRLRRAGHRLGVTGRTQLQALRLETGLAPSDESASARKLWTELTSRRSMTNLGDHLRFVGLAAPPELRRSLQVSLVANAVRQFAIRTPTGRRWRLDRLARTWRSTSTFALRSYPFPISMAAELGVDAARLEEAGLL